MIAYDFPPVNTSGSWRPFHFAKHLPEFGFIPLLVTQNGFYPSQQMLDSDILADLRPHSKIRTVRPLADGSGSTPGDAFAPGSGALNAGTSLLGRLCGRRGLGLMTLWAGLRFQQQEGFDLIWATGPPWSALVMGYRLAGLTGKPLVADIRDPWTYGVLWTKLGDKDKDKQRVSERKVLRRAQRIVYTSPLTAEIMQERSNSAVAKRILAITNGYSESVNGVQVQRSRHRCCFSYIGKIQKGIRDPSIMLEGFERACRDREFAKTAVLRLIGGVGEYRQQVAQTGSDNVESVGQVSYRESLSAMRAADVLVLLQTIRGEGNDVIGGKAYEYLAAHRPILGIVPPDGGDAWLLSSTGVGTVTGISDVERVARGFHHYWRRWKDGRLSEAPAEQNLDRFSRRKLTGDLASVFDEVLAQ